jgi:hypothetical protein
MDLITLSIIKWNTLYIGEKLCKEMFDLFIMQKAPFPIPNRKWSFDRY